MAKENEFMRYLKKGTVTAGYIFIVILASSCKKDIDLTPGKNYDPTVGVLSQIKNDNGFMPGKYIFFQVMQQPDAIDTAASFSINVFGKFVNDETGATVSAGDIVINNSQVVTGGPGNLYQYTYDRNTLPGGKAAMGNFIDIQVKGSNTVDSIKRKLYIPKPIFLRDLYKSVSTISNNRSYNLSWNADPQNMFGKILIQVDYHAGISLDHNPANPKSVEGLIYTVADNGSFVIPAADLQRFPVSSYISISISRATDNSWPTNSGHIEYIAVSASCSSPILIEN